MVMPFHVTKQLVQISASIGGAFYPHYASSADALLIAADQAMYKAKKSGSNQVCFYDTFDKPDEDASRVDDQSS